MRVRGSCVAREGLGVLMTGPAGSGKSGLALRLRSLGFWLVADDLVDVDDGFARPPAALAGLLEVRGLGIVRVAHTSARLALVAELTDAPVRLPMPASDARFGVPVIQVDARAPDAAHVVALALDCATGETCVVGAFAA